MSHIKDTVACIPVALKAGMRIRGTAVSGSYIGMYVRGGSIEQEEICLRHDTVYPLPADSLQFARRNTPGTGRK